MNENKDIYTGKHRTEQLFRKIKAIATYIAQRDGIGMKEATEQYEKTIHYQKLMSNNSDLLDKSDVEVVADYMISEEPIIQTCSECDEIIQAHTFSNKGEKKSVEQEVFENYHCMYDDIDYAPMLKKAVAEVASIVSLQKGISYEEAYRSYANSDSFKAVEDINSHLFVRPTSELALSFLDEMDRKNSDEISPKTK